MYDIRGLEEYAEKKGYLIIKTEFENFTACSLKYRDKKMILINADLSPEEYLACLSHEIGHCDADCIYDRDDTSCAQAKAEYQANKTSIQQIMPLQALERALAEGNYEVWQLAEYFGVTYDMIEKAALYYDIYINPRTAFT